ncbi:uncharacterized protein ARMOST_18488 [Armillaria ostoyae]|uniref:Uncharacterized protein n=1 Tax=Armillaria ostoyae TaxID=47428 RepID=A0A284S212_ARMOS|nr:uncharacterized protein ARMOST_18488 [Armillaria ostoyae]
MSIRGVGVARSEGKHRLERDGGCDEKYLERPIDSTRFRVDEPVACDADSATTSPAYEVVFICWTIFGRSALCEMIL